MKHVILTTFALILPLASFAKYEGIPSTILIDDGIKIEYIILSEADKTCKISNIDNSATGSITIPEIINGYYVTELGRYAFNRNSQLTSISLPQSLKIIRSCSFKGCSSLNSLVIPEGVTTIEEESFGGCSSLNSISFPNSLMSLSGSSNLEHTPWYNNQPDGLIYAGEVLYKYKGTMPEETQVNIKEGTVSISNYAFYDCNGLSSVSIPSSVQEIGISAFESCNNIKSISIADGVKTIKSYAFYGCKNLELVSFGNGLTYMGEKVFEETKWDSQLPNGLVYAGSTVYKYQGTMPANTRLTIKEGTLGIAERAFYNSTNLASIDIPNSLISIGRQAFSGCSGLLTITLPQSLKNIDAFAFKGCNKVTSISIPKSVVRIGGGAFEGCSELSKVIAEDLAAWCNISFSDTLWSNPLYRSEHLYNSDGFEIRELTIPEGVKEINDRTFINCKSLISLTLPDNLLSIGYEAFYGCTNLKDISMPNTVLTIDYNAFYGCHLETVKLPKNLRAIGQSAFYGNHLTTIEIPRNVIYIGAEAFNYNSNLTDIYSKIKTPFEISNYTFGEENSTKTLYVPYSTQFKYETTNGWSQFSGHIVEIGDSVGVNDIIMVQGKKILIGVTLNNEWNEDIYTAYQFALHLPDSIGIAVDENRDYECDLVTERYQGKTHTLTVTEKDTIIDETGTVWRNYQFICYSNKNNLIKGTEGPLLTISLSLNKDIDVAVGKAINRNGYITDIIISDENMEGAPVKNTKFKIDLYPAGDVNYDYEVDVKDIVGVVGCINKQIDEEETMIWNAADVNNDSCVNIKDIVNIIEIINNQ